MPGAILCSGHQSFELVFNVLIGQHIQMGNACDGDNERRNLHNPVDGTKLPKIPVEIRDQIIDENWTAFFPEWG